MLSRHEALWAIVTSNELNYSIQAVQPSNPPCQNSFFGHRATALLFPPGTSLSERHHLWYGVCMILSWERPCDLSLVSRLGRISVSSLWGEGVLCSAKVQPQMCCGQRGVECFRLSGLYLNGLFPRGWYIHIMSKFIGYYKVHLVPKWTLQTNLTW